MLTRDAQPRGNRTCKLIIQEVAVRHTYKMQVVESRIENGKRKQVVVAEVTTFDAQKVHEFLGRHGVLSDEILAAADTMEELGHNVAHFGILGRFITSGFEGILQ